MVSPVQALVSVGAWSEWRDMGEGPWAQARERHRWVTWTDEDVLEVQREIVALFYSKDIPATVSVRSES